MIIGNERKFMREIFELSDKEVDDVKRFMEQDFNSVPELMRLLIKSNLNDRQKMLSSYIMGNTVGFSMVQDMRSATEEGRANVDLGMAG